MISPKATIGQNVTMGANCTVWQGATICDDTSLGHGVVVGSNVWIGRGCRIGDHTRLQHGAFIPNNTVVGQSVFVGPNVTLTDDKYPKAGMPYDPHPPVLEEGCSIGAGAVILPGIRIGRNAMVGAGSIVTQDVIGLHIVKGNPARTS